MVVVRMGQSAYDTVESLTNERALVVAAGHKYQHVEKGEVDVVRGADLLVVQSGMRVDKRILSALKGRAVLTTTSGTDHIDLEAAQELGVCVVRAPLLRRDAVVHLAFAEMVFHNRRVEALWSGASAGRWGRGELPALQPKGLGSCTVAIIGLGVIGRKLAALLSLSGVRVVGVEPSPVNEDVELVTLAQALDISDVVTLHCNLNASTYGLIGAQEIAAMKRGAVLINLARGGLLDTQAAARAVERGHLAGLTVDCFEEEPYLHMARCSSPGIHFTPHAAGYTQSLTAASAQEIVDVANVLSTGDQPQYVVLPFT
jgi:D-3-phosphoglycerate dehydrogenase